MHDFTIFLLVLSTLSTSTFLLEKPEVKEPSEKREVLDMDYPETKKECNPFEEETTPHEMLQLKLPPVDPDLKDIYNWSQVIEIDPDLIEGVETTEAKENLSLECPPPVDLELKELVKRSDVMGLLPGLIQVDKTTESSYLRLKYPPPEPEVKDLTEMSTPTTVARTEVTEFNEVHELLFPPEIPEMKEVAKRSEVIEIIPADMDETTRVREVLELKLPPAEPEYGAIDVEGTAEPRKSIELELPPVIPQMKDLPERVEVIPEVIELSETTTIYEFSDLRLTPLEPEIKPEYEITEKTTGLHEIIDLDLPPIEPKAEELEAMFQPTAMDFVAETRDYLELRLPSLEPEVKDLSKRSKDAMPRQDQTTQRAETREILELRLPSFPPKIKTTTKRPEPMMVHLMPLIVKDISKRSEEIRMRNALFPESVTTEDSILSQLSWSEPEVIPMKYISKVIEPMKIKAVSVEPEGNVSKRAEENSEVHLSNNALEIVVKLVQGDAEPKNASKRSELIEGTECPTNTTNVIEKDTSEIPEMHLSNNVLEIVVKLVDPNKDQVTTTTEANECKTPVKPDLKNISKREKLIDWDEKPVNPEINLSKAAVDILVKLKTALPEELRAKPNTKDSLKIFKRAKEINAKEIPFEPQELETPATPVVIEENGISDEPEIEETPKILKLYEVKELTESPPTDEVSDQPEEEDLPKKSEKLSQEIDPVQVKALQAESEVNLSKRAEDIEVKEISLEPQVRKTPVKPVVIDVNDVVSDEPEQEEISKIVEVYEVSEITESPVALEESDQSEEEDTSIIAKMVGFKDRSETIGVIEAEHTSQIPEVKLSKNTLEINVQLVSEKPKLNKPSKMTSAQPDDKNYLHTRLSKMALSIRCCKRGLRCCNKVSKKNQETEFEVQAALEKCQKLGKAPKKSIHIERWKRQAEKNKCKNKLTDDYEVYNCKRKVVLQIMISNSGVTNCKNQFVVVDHLEDPVTGTRQKVFNPFVIRIKQQPILQVYGLSYNSAVNSKPREKIYTKKDTSYIGCDTNPFSSHPTCGLKKQNNNPIPFSTGFCCSCDKDNARHLPVNVVVNANSKPNLTFIVNITNSDDVVIVDNALNENAVDGLGHVLQKRGGQDCNDSFTPPEADRDTYHQSTHCLEFSDIWYQMYDITPPRIHHFFELDVFQKMPTVDNESDFTLISQGEPIYISEEFRQYTNEENTIAINYVPQSITPDTWALNPSAHKLLMPDLSEIEGANRFPELRGGPEEYLILNANEIQPSGNRCDTPGVGYEAFANQPDRCSVEPGSCLNNQPYDMWHHDHDAEYSGDLGKYFLKYFGQLPKDPVDLNGSVPYNKTLKFYYTPYFVSYLNMELNADNLIVLRPNHLAALTDVFVEATNPSLISITVRVFNTGLMSGVFRVVVTDCPKSLPDSFSDIHTKKVLIDPQQVHNFYLEIECYFPKTHFTCLAQVQNENQDVVAMRQIKFQEFDRCFCSWHCQCVCLVADGGLSCVPLSINDYNAAGHQGSEPLSRQIIEYTFLDETINLMMYVFMFLCIILFCMGLVKASIGCCTPTVGLWGLDVLLDLPKRINRYYESDLKGIRVEYNCEGWPIHPITKRKARNIGMAAEFSINSVFFMLYPFAIIWLLIKRLCCPRYRHYQRVPTTPCKCKKGKGVKRKKKGLQKSAMKKDPKPGKPKKDKKKRDPKDPKNAKDPKSAKDQKDSKDPKHQKDSKYPKDPKDKKERKNKKDPNNKRDSKDKKDRKTKKTKNDEYNTTGFEMKTTNEKGTNTKNINTSTNTKRKQTEDKKNKNKGTNTKGSKNSSDTKNKNKAKGTTNTRNSKLTQTTTL